MKTYSVFGNEGTIVVFEAAGYRAAKRYKAKITRFHDGERFRWSTAEERRLNPALCTIEFDGWTLVK